MKAKLITEEELVKEHVKFYKKNKPFKEVRCLSDKNYNEERKAVLAAKPTTFAELNKARGGGDLREICDLCDKKCCNIVKITNINIVTHDWPIEELKICENCVAKIREALI